VTIASGGGWTLAGVLGATGDAAGAASTLAARGFDSVLGAVGGGRGEVELAWSPAPSPAPSRRAGRRQPVEATTTGGRRCRRATKG
jgi:hypothetical protein